MIDRVAADISLLLTICAWYAMAHTLVVILISILASMSP
jgi:hypothetical protein